MVSSTVRRPRCKLYAERMAGFGDAKYLRSGAQDKSRPGRSSVVAVFIGLVGFLVSASAGFSDAGALRFKGLDARHLLQRGRSYDGRP